MAKHAPKAAEYFDSPVTLAISAIVPGFLSSHENVFPVHWLPESSYCLRASFAHLSQRDYLDVIQKLLDPLHAPF